jgi:hypothetical protein
MTAMQKEGKTISLEEKLNILWNVDRHVETCISFVKQLELPTLTLNMVSKTCHAIE